MTQKQNTLTKTGIVALLACVCCILWGSAIPVIKTGYRLMQVDSADTASQIVFAGVRFTLAGILVLIFASIKERKVMIPDREILKYARSGMSGADSGTVFLLLYRCCTYIRSQGRYYYRTWKLYCNSSVLSGFSE